MLQQQGLQFETWDWKKIQLSPVTIAKVMIVGRGWHYYTIIKEGENWMQVEKAYSKPIYNLREHLRRAIGNCGMLVTVDQNFSSRLALPSTTQPESMTEIIDIDGRSDLSREKRTREQELEPVIVGKTQVLYNERTKMYHCPVDECPYEHSSQTSVIVHYVRHCSKKKAKQTEARVK